MFRVVLPPIIMSAYNCIDSIWYLSHRYCYLPLSWKSWNRFECGVGGVRVPSCWIYEYIGILLGARPILHISRIKVNKSMNSVEILTVTHHAMNSIQTLQKSNVHYLQNKISVRSVVLKTINNDSCHLNLPICITIRSRQEKCSLPNTNFKIPDQTLTSLP
jgi:hypothetical protein